MKKSPINSYSTQSKRLPDGRYAYYPACGEPVYITPGVDVSEDIIIMLQEMDHKAALTERHEMEHKDTLTAKIGLKVADPNDSADEDPIAQIPDPAADICSLLFGEEDQPNELCCALEEALTKLTPHQIDFIYDRFGLRLTEAEIAARDGVTKQAVCNRQKKLFARIRKLLSGLDT